MVARMTKAGFRDAWARLRVEVGTDERAREAIADQLLEIAGDEFTLAQVRGELTDAVIAALDAAGLSSFRKLRPRR